MGFSKDRFVEQDRLPIDLLCPICKDVVESPKQCKNGHVYCYVCIITWLDQSKTCPVDKQSLCEDKLYDCLMAKHWVGDLLVKCENMGCTWTGPYKTVENHDNTCGLRLIECSDCKKTDILRKDIDSHKTDECPHRIVECVLGCDKMDLQFRNIETHYITECVNRMIQCNYCNNEFMHKEEHDEKCLQKPINCKHCGDRMLRFYLADHEEECVLRQIACEDCDDVVVYNQLLDHFDVCRNRYLQCPDCSWSGKRYPSHKPICRGPLTKCTKCDDTYYLNKYDEHSLGMRHMAKILEKATDKEYTSERIEMTDNYIVFGQSTNVHEGKLYHCICLTAYSDKNEAICVLNYPLSYNGITLPFSFRIGYLNSDSRFIGIYFNKIKECKLNVSGLLNVIFISFDDKNEPLSYALAKNGQYNSNSGLSTHTSGNVFSWGNDILPGLKSGVSCPL